MEIYLFIFYMTESLSIAPYTSDICFFTSFLSQVFGYLFVYFCGSEQDKSVAAAVLSVRDVLLHPAAAC